MNPLKNLRSCFCFLAIFAVNFRKSNKADAIAQRLCLCDIGSQNLSYAANVYTAKIDDRPKAERRQNR